jgi:hypothetical protein
MFGSTANQLLRTETLCGAPLCLQPKHQPIELHNLQTVISRVPRHHSLTKRAGALQHKGAA